MSVGEERRGYRPCTRYCLIAPKSLVNGQCGGAKNGKCEVDPNMECGWERIYQKLKKIGRLDALKCPVQIRNYATDDQAKA